MAPLDELAGTWRCVACAQDGRQWPAELVARMWELVIAGDTFKICAGAHVCTEGRIALPSDGAIDFIPHCGDLVMSGSINLGIYHLERNQLTTCLAGSGCSSRPVGFQTRPHDMLQVWERKAAEGE